MSYSTKKSERDCETHGLFSGDDGYFNGELKFKAKCPECESIKHQEKVLHNKSIKQKADLAKYVKKLNDSGIPKRYQQIKLKDIKPNESQVNAFNMLSKFSDNFEDMESKGQCVVLIGGTGTGKTMLSCALLQTVGEGMYIRALDVSRKVRHAYSENNSELDTINQFVSQKLLVIDEIGVQMNTESEARLITDLIDQRYAEMKPTIFLSNLKQDQIKQSLGERAFSRIMQNGIIIPFYGPSQR